MTRNEAAIVLQDYWIGESMVTVGQMKTAVNVILTQGYAPEGKVIVAVNSHDDLVKALEGAIQKLKKCARWGGNDEEAIAEMLAPFCAVLKRAKE